MLFNHDELSIIFNKLTEMSTYSHCKHTNGCFRSDRFDKCYHKDKKCVICNKLIVINNLRLTCKHYNNMIGSLLNYMNYDDFNNIKCIDYKYKAYFPLKSLCERIAFFKDIN